MGLHEYNFHVLKVNFCALFIQQNLQHNTKNAKLNGCQIRIPTYFRPHQQFLDDVLEGFIIAAALDHFGLSNETEMPSLNKPPILFQTYCPESQYKWMCQQARLIRNKLTLNDTNPNIGTPMKNMNAQEQWLNSTMKDDGRYHCPHCQNKYTMIGWLKKHLQTKHDVVLECCVVQ